MLATASRVENFGSTSISVAYQSVSYLNTDFCSLNVFVHLVSYVINQFGKRWFLCVLGLYQSWPNFVHRLPTSFVNQTSLTFSKQQVQRPLQKIRYMAHAQLCVRSGRTDGWMDGQMDRQRDGIQRTPVI